MTQRIARFCWSFALFASVALAAEEGVAISRFVNAGRSQLDSQVMKAFENQR